MTRALRAALIGAQAKDDVLSKIIARLSDASKPRLSTDEYDLAADGALEVRVVHSDGKMRAVPAVPSSDYRPGQSWRAFFFRSAHIGVFGGHKNAPQTIELLTRLCHWRGLKKEVERWVDECYTCNKFRRRPLKVLTSHFLTSHNLPWHHVLIDFEGPITPADREGFRYILTYTCLLCGGSLLECVRDLTHSEVRKALFALVMRCLLYTSPSPRD